MHFGRSANHCGVICVLRTISYVLLRVSVYEHRANTSALDALNEWNLRIGRLSVALEARTSDGLMTATQSVCVFFR